MTCSSSATRTRGLVGVAAAASGIAESPELAGRSGSARTWKRGGRTTVIPAYKAGCGSQQDPSRLAGAEFVSMDVKLEL